MEQQNIRHIGRFGQIGVCLGKLYRMFLFQRDWLMLPMSAVIAGLVAMATGRATFITMEGTQTGTFALTCVCIWNGFFNSIQVICRERSIIKREHRAGLHITSYVAAHLIYQMSLCAAQSIIMMMVCGVMGIPFPTEGILFPGHGVLEIFITFFLITYAADTMSLMVSSIVHTTTAAMTVMPFLLILELVFSGGIFSLPAGVRGITELMISKWGMQCLCAQGGFNSLPSTMIWNKLVAVGDGVNIGPLTLKDALAMIQENGGREDFLQKMSELNYNANYVSTADNILNCWGSLILFVLVFAVVTVLFLEFVDKDRR